MDITDELRKCAQSRREIIDDLDAGDIDGLLDDIELIADRIDAEYQKAIRELNNLADASVLLPVDADGVSIRVGDVMRHLACVNTETVCGIGYNTFFTRDNHGEFYRHPASTYVHYHEPTVEDVLSEMLEQAFPSDFMHRSEAIEAMVAEYAAKLRLADGKE